MTKRPSGPGWRRSDEGGDLPSRAAGRHPQAHRRAADARNADASTCRSAATPATPTACSCRTPVCTRSSSPWSTADGTVLQRVVLYLNRVPATPVKNPLQLGARAPDPLDLGGPAGLDLGGARPRQRRQLERAADLLQAHPAIATSVEPPPNLLDALAASGSPDDRALLARLTTVLRANAGRETLRSPWAAIQVESWATTGTLADLQTPLVAGQLDRSRTAPVRRCRAGTGSSTPPSGRARSVTSRRSVSTDSSWTRNRSTPQRHSARSRARPGRSRSRAAGSPTGRSLSSRASPQTSRRATCPHAQAAHDAITEMQAIWFAAPTDVTTGFALDIDDAVPTDRVAALLTTLDTGTPLVAPSPLSAALDRTSSYVDRTDRRTRPLTRQLQKAVGTTNVAPLSSYLTQLRTRTAAYHSSMADTPGLVPLDSMLLGSQDRSLGEPRQRALLDSGHASDRRRLRRDPGAGPPELHGDVEEHDPAGPVQQRPRPRGDRRRQVHRHEARHRRRQPAGPRARSRASHA